MMFILCLFLLHAAFSEVNNSNIQWVVNQQFNITPIKKEDAKMDFYFDFNCPKGFIRYYNYCYLNEAISKLSCPKLNDLNTTYSLSYHKDDVNPGNIFDLNCFYPMEDFFKITQRNNSMTLNLFRDSSKGEVNIFLDVFLDQPENSLNILCLSRNRDGTSKIKINEENNELKENATTRRFYFDRANIGDNLSIFYCCAYVPGKIKPIGSNIVFGNRHKENIFIASFNKKIDKNVGIRICALNETKRNYIVQMDHITNMYHKILKEKYIRDKKNLPSLIELKSPEYCFEETSNKTTLIWPETLIGEISYPEKLCLDKNNQFIKRKCKGNYLDGGEWDEEIECFNKTLPLVTQNLLKIEFITNQNLNDIEKIVRNENLSDYDVNVILNIFKNTKKINESSENQFFSIINNISKFNFLTLTTKSKIIKNIEGLIAKMNKKDDFVIKNHGDIKYLSINPFKINDSMKFDNNFEIVLTKDFLSSLNIHESEKKYFVMNVISFENKNLFLKNDQINNAVIDVNFKGIENNKFSEPIILSFPREDDEPYKCGYWDETTKMWSTSGVLTKIKKESIECRSYHLTKFSLLIVSSDIIIMRRKNYKTEKILDFISTIELFVSAVGCIIVLLLAISLREWRTTRYYVTQLSLVIFLEACLLITVDLSERIMKKKFCIYFALSLHFIVLEKFLLMFLIGLSQLENFMKIFKKLKKIVLRSSCNGALFRWIVPFLIVFISSLCYSDEKYYRTDEEIKFCYPKQEPHLYFVIIPVSIVLCFNAIVFVIVLTKISGSPSIDAQKKLFRFKLTVMLWFLLGGSWISGALINTRQGGIFEDICHYIFVLIAPLQGFVVFLFYVVLDKSSNQIVKKSIWSVS